MDAGDDDKNGGGNWKIGREGQNAVLQARPVKVMRSKRTRSGQGQVHLI